MPAYDAARFQPPAPVARVTLRNPATGAVCADVPMLLDSGADVSLVPEPAVRLLGIVAIPGQEYELVAFDGTISFAPVVPLELVFCHRTFRGPDPLPSPPGSLPRRPRPRQPPHRQWSG